MSGNALRYIDELRTLPTSVNRQTFELYGHNCTGVHESTLRAWRTLMFTVGLLRKGVDPELVADIIEAIMDWDGGGKRT